MIFSLKCSIIELFEKNWFLTKNGPAAWILFFSNFFFHFIYCKVNLNNNQIVHLRSFEIFDIALSITHSYYYLNKLPWRSRLSQSWPSLNINKYVGHKIFIKIAEKNKNYSYILNCNAILIFCILNNTRILISSTFWQ